MSTCPRGLVNDPYPGSCGQYIDVNQDQLCDLSQTIPTTSGATPINNPLPTMSFDYTLIILFFLPILIYVFTSKFKLFWNISLLITCIPTTISTLGYIFGFFNPILNAFHLRFGTVFIAIAIIHALWHLPYWQGVAKKISSGA